MIDRAETYKNANKLFFEIKKRGIKQAWVAEQLGISKQRLNQYLLGTRTMPNGYEDVISRVIS